MSTFVLRRFTAVLCGLLLVALTTTGLGTSTAHAVGSGGLSGTVTMPGSDAPDTVEAQLYTMAMGVAPLWYKTARVNASGSYSFEGLNPGAYRVRFVSSSADVATEWFGEAFSVYNAPAVTVGSTAVTNIDVTLGRAASLAGTVTTPSPDPKALYVSVLRYNDRAATWEAVPDTNSVSTIPEIRPTATGAYSATKLPAGRYQIRVTGISSFISFYPGGDQPAQDVLLGDGENRTGLDIAYTLTDPPKAPAAEPEAPTAPAPEAPTAAPEAPTAPAEVKAPVGKIKLAKKPKVTGKAKIGATFKVGTGSWTPGKVKLTYQWVYQAGGKTVPLRASTKNKLKLTKKLRGKRVRVQVTATASGFQKLVVTSGWSKKIKR